MKYKFLLFDMDQTIFNYKKGNVSALEITFNKFGLNFSQQILDEYRSINKKLWSDFELNKISGFDLRSARFKKLFEKLEIDADAVEVSSEYLRNLSNQREYMPGAEEMLEKVKSDFKLGIITNGFADVQYPRLAGSSISDLFDKISVSEESGYSKPDSGIFDYTFKLYDIEDKNDVLIIGDNLQSDIKGGNDYGIDTCWYNPKELLNDSNIAPTFEVQNWNQFLKEIY